MSNRAIDRNDPPMDYMEAVARSSRRQTQEQLKMLITQTPPEFREAIEQQADLSGLKKTPDGYERMNRTQASG